MSRTPTTKELAERVRLIEEQMVSLIEMLVVQDPPEAGAPGSLEAQHRASLDRLKEKRR